MEHHDDWKNDRFLGEFLVVGVEPDPDPQELENDLQNFTDLGQLSAADDDLVSYLSGEMFPNKNPPTSGFTSRRPTPQAVIQIQTSKDQSTELESSQSSGSGDSEAEPQLVLMESVKFDLQSHVDAETLELEDCGMEDCIDLGSSVSADDDDDDGLVSCLSVSSNSVSNTGKESTVRAKESTVRAKESTVSSDKHNSQPQSQKVSLATSQRIKQMIANKNSTNLATPAVKRTAEPERHVSELVTELSPKRRRGECASKGAIASRERRQKNKEYLASLEDSVEKLFKENVLLKKQDTEKTRQVAELQEEVRFLKQVVANNSTLSSLLKNILSVNGLKLACSLPPVAAEQDENRQNKNSTGTANGEKRKHSHKAFEWNESNPPMTNSSKRPRCLRDIFQNSVCASSSTVHTASPSDRQPNIGDSQETAGTKKTPAGVRRDVQANLELEENGGDHDNGKSGNDVEGGICLHVRGDSVSIELCAACNHRATKCQTIHHGVESAQT